MSAPDPSAVGKIIGSIGLVLSYGIALWRIFRRSHGDRFIEFGIATMFVWIVMVALHRIPSTPEWVNTALLFPLYLLCVASIWSLLQQGYRAFRRRKARSAR
jgi:Ca2+/Na+ antiporter